VSFDWPGRISRARFWRTKAHCLWVFRVAVLTWDHLIGGRAGPMVEIQADLLNRSRAVPYLEACVPFVQPVAVPPSCVFSMHVRAMRFVTPKESRQSWHRPRLRPACRVHECDHLCDGNTQFNVATACSPSYIRSFLYISSQTPNQCDPRSGPFFVGFIQT
jgi:hypothetical protein